jgi:exonuclease VII large subunit
MGYVIIRQKKLIITSKELINKNQIIQIQFHDGKISTINTQYKNEQF